MAAAQNLIISYIRVSGWGEGIDLLGGNAIYGQGGVVDIIFIFVFRFDEYQVTRYQNGAKNLRFNTPKDKNYKFISFFKKIYNKCDLDLGNAL